MIDNKTDGQPGRFNPVAPAYPAEGPDREANVTENIGNPEKPYTPRATEEPHNVIISITTSTTGKPDDLVQRVRREMELLLGADRFTLSVTPW